jgi:RNA-binding proteins (RRM domain)
MADNEDVVATEEEQPTATEETPAETEANTVEQEVAEEEEIGEYVCPPEFNEKEEMRKMFVGGLDKETTDEEFKELFTKYGAVKDFIIIKKENNKSDRLFGFITFENCDDLEECLLARPHKYKDKELDVKRAVPKSDAGGDQNGHLRVKKLHVANVPATFDITALTKYLKKRHPEKFGSIEDINFVKVKDADGKPTDKNRGFGFINVSTEDFADRIAIAETKFNLDGNSLRISKAKPKDGTSYLLMTSLYNIVTN